jgi:hypothetical protein
VCVCVCVCCIVIVLLVCAALCSVEPCGVELRHVSGGSVACDAIAVLARVLVHVLIS